MADTIPSSDASATPVSGTPATGTPASSGATPQKPGVTLEEALARIEELTHLASNKDEEAKRHGSKLTAAEKQLAVYQEKERLAQEAALSEMEKSNKRATEAEAKIKQYQQELITAQVKLAAKDMGIIDPDIAALAIQKTLEYGDDGMPSNLDAALKALVKQKPYLVPVKAEPATPAAQTATQPATQTPTIPAMNPGRSSFGATNQPTGKPTRFSDIDWSHR